MLAMYSNADLRQEIQVRRRKVHKYVEEILCQQPRMRYTSEMIYLHWAMFYMRKILPWDEECICATILIYARPIRVMRFNRPFHGNAAILHTDVGHPCFDATVPRLQGEEERPMKVFAITVFSITLGNVK